MKFINLARSIVCVAMACASLGGALVAFKSAGEPGRMFVAAPTRLIAAVVWLVGAFRVHSLRLTIALFLLFLCLLVIGVILSLSSGFNFTICIDPSQNIAIM